MESKNILSSSINGKNEKNNFTSDEIATSAVKIRELRNSWNKYTNSLQNVDWKSQLVTDVIINIEKIESLNDVEIKMILKHYEEYFEIFDDEKTRNFNKYHRLNENGRNNGGNIGCFSSQALVEKSIENY